MLLRDRMIREYCLNPIYHGENGAMLSPFSEPVSGDGIISYGLTSAGYDLRLGKEIWVYKNTYGEVVDPKRFKDREYRERVFDWYMAEKPVIIPAHGYILGSSLEYIRMPRQIKGRCVGKSTYARTGIIINTTPLEPGWSGLLTIEIANTNPSPALVYPMEGIAQLEFEYIDGVPEQTYDTKHGGKAGKYQDQQGVTPAKVL